MPKKKTVNYDKLLKAVDSGLTSKEIMEKFGIKTSAQLKGLYLDALVSKGRTTSYDPVKIAIVHFQLPNPTTLHSVRLSWTEAPPGTSIAGVLFVTPSQRPQCPSAPSR